MATGDDSIYHIVPTPLTLQADKEDNNQGDELDTFLENVETFNVDIIGVSKPSTSDTADQRDQILTTSSKRPKIVKSKISSQLVTSRNAFTAIPEKQAEASKVMAESLLTIGKSLEKMADNDERRILNDKKMLELYEKILEKM